MRRLLSFRDFDWTLLGMVLLLCTVSVFEVYSATLHTRFVGFHTKQILFIAVGLVVMAILAKVDYHRLLDWVPWAYGVSVIALGKEIPLCLYLNDSSSQSGIGQKYRRFEFSLLQFIHRNGLVPRRSSNRTSQASAQTSFKRTLRVKLN